MSENKITFRTPLFDKYFDIVFQKEQYELTKKNYADLHIPKFTIKDIKLLLPDITYRKINFWDSNDLLDFSRNKKGGWRRFSPYNTIIIQVICDLKNLGFKDSSIRQIISSIKNQHGEFAYKLEHFMFGYGIFKYKYLLIVDEFNNAVFCPEEAFVEMFFRANYATEPVVILPFTEYINNFNEKTNITKK